MPSLESQPPSRPRSLGRGKLVTFVLDRLVVVLALLWVFGVGILVWHVRRVQDRLVETTTRDGARLQSELLSEFRTIYTSEVVERAQLAAKATGPVQS